MCLVQACVVAAVLMIIWNEYVSHYQIIFLYLLFVMSSLIVTALPVMFFASARLEYESYILQCCSAFILISMSCFFLNVICHIPSYFISLYQIVSYSSLHMMTYIAISFPPSFPPPSRPQPILSSPTVIVYHHRTLLSRTITVATVSWRHQGHPAGGGVLA